VALRARTGCEPIERRLGGRALDNEIRHRVGVLLVDIAFLADATEELDTRALLYHVCRLVRCGVQAGRGSERDLAPARVGLRADRAARSGRLAADVGLDTADVVSAEQTLDLVAVGQRATGAGDALLGGAVDHRAVDLRWGRACGALDRGQLPGERALARGKSGAAGNACRVIVLACRSRESKRHVRRLREF
jgi:hypothetical protein